MTCQNALQPSNVEARSVRVSINMPADMVAALKVAGFQRRSLGETQASTAQLIREAVTDWLEKEIADPKIVSIQLRS